MENLLKFLVDSVGIGVSDPRFQLLQIFFNTVDQFQPWLQAMDSINELKGKPSLEKQWIGHQWSFEQTLELQRLKNFHKYLLTSQINSVKIYSLRWAHKKYFLQNFQLIKLADQRIVFFRQVGKRFSTPSDGHLIAESNQSWFDESHHWTSWFLCSQAEDNWLKSFSLDLPIASVGLTFRCWSWLDPFLSLF